MEVSHIEDHTKEARDSKISENSDHSYCIHYMLKSAWKNNFGAPVRDMLSSDPGAKVLDFGCSSGYWTLEMATEFPLANFYGVDSTSSFPDTVTPENVEFMLANIISDGLPFEDAEFDYVFGRNLMFIFQTSSLKSIVMKELLRVLKPGGYIELVEGDYQGYNSSDSFKFWNYEGLMPWLNSLNIDHKLFDQFKEYLISIDQLEDVTEQKVKIPFGRNKFAIEGEEFIGELSSEITLSFMRSVADQVMPFMKLTHEEYMNLIDKIQYEANSESNDNYLWYRRYIAKKI